ncbi:MAG: hypothetical protein JSU66_16815, partial [Deltaproteobacteria bacterium]
MGALDGNRAEEAIVTRRKGDENRKDWSPWLAELSRRRARALEMGGAERVERLMHARGKLDARQRIERLFDPGTFVEI